MLKRQPKKKPLSQALSLSKLTGSSGELHILMSHANNLSKLNTAFEHCLPKQMQGKFQVNSLDKQILTITCHSAAFATRFRLLQNQIIQELSKELDSRINAIQIKIRPARFSAQVQLTERKISKENAQLLQNEAEQTTDEKLKEALSKLARRCE